MTVKRPKVYIDFEYNRTRDAFINLVACGMRFEDNGSITWWLDKEEKAQAELKRALLEIRETHTLVAFNVVAEASSIISLKLDPTKFQWIDLQLEWKMLLNHNHKYMYGPQLIGGIEKNTKPPKPKWQMTEEEQKRADSSKPEKSLAAAVYKMLGQKIDTDHKDAMRDLIISCPTAWSEEDKLAVLNYCQSDVDILPPLDKALMRALQETTAFKRGDIRRADLLWRGESAARTALMTQTGYPVNAERVQKFSAAVPSILEDMCEDTNRQLPEHGIFEWNKKRKAYSLKQRPLRNFIARSPYSVKWQRTQGGHPSLALEAWTRHYSYSHHYPEGDLPAQVIRYLKTKQNLNGFLPTPEGSDRKTFFDYYGDDGRARCWLNPYGSQSSRFQPSATGFIPLKSAWMRSLIEPQPGFSIASIDYASEEFLLAALLSGDQRMYEAYASGDPYLTFAKQSGAVPPNATKDTHPTERTRFKSTVLGISYLMGHISLAAKLTDDTGIHHTPEDAEKLINLFFEVYSDYAKWIEKTLYDYKERGYLRLLDGWIMFGDNDNYRSVSNCPTQGTGAVILRRAVKNSQEKGLRVIIPLHDALYIEYPTDKPEKIDQLADSMLDAFSHYFTDPKIREWSKAIRLDLDAWGPDLAEGKLVTPAGREVKTQEIYVDPRGKKEFERFSRYFS